MKKKLFQKKNLSLDCDDDGAMAGSVYSEIGPDGLKFLKDNIKVSKDGLSKLSGDQMDQHFQPITMESLQIVNKHLGRGAAGSVQEAIFKPLNKKVAIKSINAYDREKRHQLMNDIRILLQNKINAENNSYYCQFLVDLYGAFYDEGSVKIVLELMDAGSLGDIIRIYRAADVIPPNIPESVLAKISQQILNGLSYLHTISHQIHRDIKPDNILLNSNGYVKLTDFGISRDLEQSAFCTTFVGTYTYMSPERIEGKRYNHLSDVWSFGLMLLELANGKYPYASTKTYIEMLQQVVNEEPPQLPDSFSKEMKDFISLCLQQKPSKRASAVELLVILHFIKQFQSHQWILKNFAQAPTISQWLNQVKQTVFPIAEQRQKLKQNQKDAMAQEYMSQLQSEDSRKSLNQTGQSIMQRESVSQQSVKNEPQKDFSSSSHSIRMVKDKDGLINSISIN